MYKRLAKEEIDKIKQRYLQGESGRKIARSYNIAPHTVQYHVSERRNIRDRELATKWAILNPKQHKYSHDKWMKTHKPQIARTYVRYWIKKAIEENAFSIEEIQDILKGYLKKKGELE